MAQWVKELVLSLLWLRSCCDMGLTSGLGASLCCRKQQQPPTTCPPPKDMFSFVRNLQSVFQSGRTTLHSSKQWEFFLLHIVTSIWYCQCSRFWLSSRYVAVSYCFYFYFPGDRRCGMFFHDYLLFVVGCLLRSLAHILVLIGFSFWILRVLCVFWVTVIYWLFLCKYFISVLAYLYLLLTVYFTEQKFLFLFLWS